MLTDKRDQKEMSLPEKPGLFFRLILAVFILVSSFQPAICRAADQPLEEAPVVQLQSVELKEIESAISSLESAMRRQPPNNAARLRETFLTFGDRLGLWTDVATLSGEALDADINPVLSEKLERFGLAFTVFTCLEKQLVHGEPQGHTAMYEAAKFLMGKVPGVGGPAAAGMGVLKYAMDTFGNACLDQIASDYRESYMHYHENTSTFKDWWDRFQQPNGGQAVEKALDAYWDSGACTGMRGWHAFKSQHESKDYKKVYRDWFLEEYLYPAMLQEAQIQFDVEKMALQWEAELAAKGLGAKRCVVSVPNIIERGDGGPARNMKAMLLHSGRYIIAQGTLNGGVSFEFPVGKMYRPDTKKQVMRMQLVLEPVPPATLQAGNNVRIDLDLKRVHPDTKRVFGKEITAYTFGRKRFVHLAYPVEVTVQGEGKPIPNISVTSFPAIAPHTTSTSGYHPLFKKQGDSFSCPAVPAGHCIFTASVGRLGEADIAGSARLSFSRPPAASANASVSLPGKPDMSSTAGKITQVIAQRKTFTKPESEIKAEAGSASAQLGETFQEFQAQCRSAWQRLSEKSRALDKVKMDPAQKKSLKSQITKQFEQLRQIQTEAAKERNDLTREVRDEYAATQKTIRELDRTLNDNLKIAETDMKGAYERADTLNREISETMRNIFQENWSDMTAFTSESEADAQIAKLEADVGRLEEQLQSLTTALSEASVARGRVEELHRELGKRSIARERSLPKIPSLFTDLERIRAVVDALKKGNGTRFAQTAMKLVKKKHAIRKKNAAEVERLVSDLKKLLASLPDGDPAKFEKAAREFGEEFDVLLDTSGRKARKKLAALSDDVATFLNRNKAVVGDLRVGKQRSETAFSRIDAINKRLMEMRDADLIRRTPDLYNFWGTYTEQLTTLHGIRTTSAAFIAALEGDIDRARDDLSGFLKACRKRRAEAETRVAECEQVIEGKTGDVGEILEKLDQTWRLCDELPVTDREKYRGRIEVAAERLAMSGEIEKYAKRSRRPLIYFESYSISGDPDSRKNPTPVKRAYLRLKVPASASPQTWGIGLKAVIIGPQKPLSAIIEVGSREYETRYRSTMSRFEPGVYHVGVGLWDRTPHLDIIGASSSPPIAYPFLHQIVFER